MREERAPVGGEGNGGVILPELHLGRDAPVGVTLILQLLLEDAKPLSAIVDRYPRYSIVKDKTGRPDVALEQVYDALRRELAGAAVDLQDGVRRSWPGRWAQGPPSAP